ncbi:MAG TPA: HAMP domain-containing protein, partial [Acidimicrobiales bacterium]
IEYAQLGPVAGPIISSGGPAAGDGGSDDLDGTTAELVLLSKAIQTAGQRRSVVENVSGTVNSGDLITVINRPFMENHAALEMLAQIATPGVVDRLDALEQTDDYRYTIDVVDKVAADMRAGETSTWDVPRAVAANQFVIDEMVDMRSDIVDNAVAEATTARDDARRDATVTIAVTLVLGLLLIALTVVLYRSIRRPLRKVSDRSRHVAQDELPGIVELMRTNPDAEVPEIEPIEATSKDEIGELVEAFNEMSGTAIQLAGEQAASRRNVGDMFMNLGRRNQKLLNRMLKDLSELERTQEDADTLAALYGIDHLATRMRRNAESLLVLAGADQARRWKEPISSGDVVRAALSEVENYERVIIDDDGTYKIAGDYVADLAHLLAELIENALVFSPPTSSVQVVTRMTERGFVIAILDSGVGMSDERLTEANARIASAADEYETPSSFLGHFVVGRIAARRGLEVALLEGPAGGLAARVMVPSAALVVPADGVASLLAIEPIEPSEEMPRRDRVTAGAVLAPVLPLSAGAPSAPLATAPGSAPSNASLSPTAPVDPVSAPSTGTLPSRTGGAADAPVTRFGVSARRPGASLPDSTVTTSPAPSAPARPDLGDPDAVRTSLSGFQEGTRRADDVAAAPETKFGVSARRPGASMPATSLPAKGSVPASDAAEDHGDPDAVRNSLSSFQRGTSRADREGEQ